MSHPEIVTADTPEREWGVPSEGDHDAVFADWWTVTSKHGDRGVKLIWQITERDEQGYRRIVSTRCGWTLNTRSKLRMLLEAWLGKPLTKEQVYEEGVWLEVLIGVPAIVTVKHEPWKPNRPWAALVGIRPWPYQCGRLPPTVEAFVRHHEHQLPRW